MRTAFTIFFCSSFLFCGQTDDTGMITYRILESEIRLTGEAKYFDVSIELTNSTSKNFILYGFKRAYYSYRSDSGLRSNPQGAGNDLFVIDSLGNEMPEEFSLEMHGDDYLQKPVTEDSLLSVFDKIRSEYTNGKEVLKSGEAKRTRLRFDVKSSSPVQQLKSGVYRAYFIYYAAKDLTRTVEDVPFQVSMVDEAVMKSDIKKYDATVFNGWVKSNLVKLIVE